jgi:hypothetical protein
MPFQIHPNLYTNDELRELYEQGLTLKELADRFGQSDETIRRAMNAAGIPRRPRGQPVGKYLPNGGRTIDKSGYVLLLSPGHPHANSGGYVREHRLVMEQTVGRYLRPEEVVHHRNGVKDDNRPENLQLYASNGAHKMEDMFGNQWAKGDFGNPKRKVRVFRTPEQILTALKGLATTLNRPIRRSDLKPPCPSYRAVARAFGSWEKGVAMALDDEYRAAVEAERGPIADRREAA